MQPAVIEFNDKIIETEDGKPRKDNSICKQFRWSIELWTGTSFRNDPKFAFFGINDLTISSAQAAISEWY
jgi:hypothetical protein